MWHYIFTHFGTQTKLHYTLTESAILSVKKFHRDEVESTIEKKLKDVAAGLEYLSTVEQKYTRAGYHVHHIFPKPAERAAPQRAQSRAAGVAELCEILGENALALYLNEPTHIAELRELLSAKTILQFSKASTETKGELSHTENNNSAWSIMNELAPLTNIQHCIFEHHRETLVRQIGHFGLHWGNLSAWQTLFPQLLSLRLTGTFGISHEQHEIRHQALQSLTLITDGFEDHFRSLARAELPVLRTLQLSAGLEHAASANDARALGSLLTSSALPNLEHLYLEGFNPVEILPFLSGRNLHLHLYHPVSTNETEALVQHSHPQLHLHLAFDMDDDDASAAAQHLRARFASFTVDEDRDFLLPAHWL